jgi:hypothetical protein
MAETAAIDRPTVAKSACRPRFRKPATVSASALALHLDCSRTYIGKLEAEGVIQRQGDGFPLDQSRVAYLRYLRRERQPSPRLAADADYVKVKTEMLQTRLMEKKRELVRRDDVHALIDGICGVTLMHLSGLAARAPTIWRCDARSRKWCGRSGARSAEHCIKLADERGEPPLSEQG